MSSDVMSPRATSLVLWLFVAVAVVTAVVMGVSITKAHRHTQACRDWSSLLDQRSREDRQLVGRATARQFRAQMERSGVIDDGGRLVRRPADC